MSPLSDIGSHEYQPTKSTSRNNSPRSSKPHSRSESPSPKPPVPTTPKPVFNRPRSSRRSVDGAPRVEDPLTTTLSPTERAELVKKTRKLTQMFGQTPGPDLTSPSPVVNSPLQQSLLAPDVRRGHRVVASIPNPSHPSDRGVWPPPEETLYLNINGRRHSTPLSPMTVSSMWGSDEDVSVLDHDQRSFYSNKPSRVRLSRKEKSSSIVSTVPSPMSFIDLSDDDSAAETPKDIIDHRHQAPLSRESPTDDTASLLTLTSAQVHEEERRWKREKLVKLHRYLGSRVPADLVLGLDLSLSPPLPPPALPDMEPEDTRKKFRMRRRRSGSCAEYTKPLTTREDRMKSELDMQEKALNVRRAAKMEKVGTLRTFRCTFADLETKGVWSRSATNPLSHPKIGFTNPAEPRTSFGIIGGRQHISCTDASGLPIVLCYARVRVQGEETQAAWYSGILSRFDLETPAQQLNRGVQQLPRVSGFAH